MQVTNRKLQSPCRRTFVATVFWTMVLGACAGSQRSSNPFDLAVTPVGASQESQQLNAEVLFVGGVSGRVGTCGCAVNPKGGLDRRINYIRSLPTRSSRIIVDAGNTLLRSMQLSSAQRPLAEQLAREILAAHQQMGIQAQGVGGLDLGLGVEFLKETAKKNSIPLVSSNLRDSKTREFVFLPSLPLKTPEMSFTVLALTRNVAGFDMLSPHEALELQLRKIPKTDLVVILSDLGTVADRDLAAKIQRPTLWIGSRELGSLEIPVHQSQALMVQTQIEGQQWGRLEFRWSPEGSSWSNLGLLKEFRARWAQLESERRRFKERGDAREDMARVDEAFEDLRRYQPQSGASLYRHQLVDMGAAWAQPNEWTQKTKDLSRF